MTKLVFVLLAVSCGGCAHYMTYKSPDEFTRSASKEVEEKPFYANSQEFADSAMKCDKLKGRERSDCISDTLEVSMAHVNKRYPLADASKVKDDYLVSRDSSVNYLKENTPQTIDKKAAKGREDILDSYYKLMVYEYSARHQQILSQSKTEYSEHVQTVERYNSSVDQENASWAALGGQLHQNSQDSQIHQLQQQQRELQWQQQTGGRGIRPAY